jgi:YegS/Rv2252/BmrU family lipid kinase
MQLICNMHAGRGATERALPELRRCLDERGLEHGIAATQGPGDATRLARAALAEGVRFVVAVGGDGTIHEVVNGMLEDDGPVRDDAVMGVVATGVANDFIRTFGMPAIPSHAAAHLDGPESFAIDIGKITCSRDDAEVVRYFANVAQAGLGARVARRAVRLRGLGALTYPAAFWIEAVRSRALEAAVDLVDKRYQGPVRNLVVANGQFSGAGMKVAPRAAPTDGVLDVQIHFSSARETIATMPRVYRGEHVPHPQIREAKRVRATIEAALPLPVEADGEQVGVTPATFEVLRDVLRLKV